MHGALQGRVAQLAMMAAYRASWPVLRRLVPLLAQLGRVGSIEDLRRIVVYIAVTTRDAEDWRRFATAIRQEVPTIGGELMNKAEEMLEASMGYLAHRARQEARREVRQEAREARQEARQAGLEEGRQEGREEGREEGRQEGRREGQVEIVENFLKAGVPWSTIEAATGIDQDKLRALKQRARETPNGSTATD